MVGFERIMPRWKKSRKLLTLLSATLLVYFLAQPASLSFFTLSRYWLGDSQCGSTDALQLALNVGLQVLHSGGNTW